MSHKNQEKPFLKVWHYMPLSCYRQESDCKQASIIFLPTSEHILSDDITFKKKNHRQLPKKQNRYLHYLRWLRFFCEAGFFFRGLETRSGCEKWCGIGVKACF